MTISSPWDQSDVSATLQRYVTLIPMGQSLYTCKFIFLYLSRFSCQVFLTLQRLTVHDANCFFNFKPEDIEYLVNENLMFSICVSPIYRFMDSGCTESKRTEKHRKKQSTLNIFPTLIHCCKCYALEI